MSASYLTLVNSGAQRLLWGINHHTTSNHNNIEILILHALS